MDVPEVTGDLDQLRSLDRQITFAAARALTATAKEAQQASINAIEQTFTTRGPWYLPGNKLGVRITPATKQNLEAAVHTDADFLKLHETSGTKTPKGSHLAIPTRNVRHTPRQTIQRPQRPKNLKRTFVVKTKKGTRIIFQRAGKGKRSDDMRAMYILEPRARIRKESTVIGPTVKVVERRFGQNFQKAFGEALATAK
ncbi:MAG TPA: phage tail protein [Pyrinomonadaceae bacterium]|nr:phage tail protein [Pyrinomonadaceae bacterium]